MTEELMKRERWLEQKMEGLGASRYYDRLAAQGDEAMPAGKRLIKSMIPKVAEGIKGWLDEATSGRAGRDVGAAQFVRQFDHEDLAYLACRVVVSSAGTGMSKLGYTAMMLARTLEDAMYSETFKQADPKAYGKLVRKIEAAKYPGRKHIIWKNETKKAAIKSVKWDNNTRMRVGAILLQIVCEKSGMFYVENVYRQGKTHAHLFATDETKQWLEGAHAANSLMEPHYMPMVVPPRPWTTPFDGGYYSKALKLRLVSSLRVRAEYFEELKSAKMEGVYRAVNAMQATPWRINAKVHDVMRVAWESDGRLGGLPPRDDLPKPVAPWGSGEPEDDGQVREYKASLARWHDANEQALSRRFQMVRKLWLANEYRNDEALYFPHTIDFRGRAYPVVEAVSPQADDSGRALLEFARPMPLGEAGAFWLAVHGANTFGEDKVPLKDRVQWALDNSDAIYDSACDPFDGQRFWTQADKPYLFLAFCFEWAALVDHVNNGGQEATFESRLPVGMDGSCNGLQNFSAMLRDEVGGAATNLIPGEKPADIYQRVADEATRVVEKDAANGEVNAVYWLGKVTRRIAKRPTMTLPYGSGQYGFTSQIEEELTRLKREAGKPYLMGDPHLCSRYLGGVLYRALGSVVVKALDAMEWLKKVSSAVAKEGHPVWWTAPSGFPVCQVYRRIIAKRVDFEVFGKRFTLNLSIDGDEIDARKQAQAIAPNFVHSLDAAHMVATVVKCLDAGITDFAMVHDSYGVHAGHVETMNRLLREAFVEQYTRPVLQEFVDSVLARAEQAKLPPPPESGTLDLEGVKASEYFFA